MFYAGFDRLFSILFPILFLVVLGMILYTIIGNISTWNKNNYSPRLTVPATVVAKRTEVSRHHTDDTMAHTFTTYYVTFAACGRRTYPLLQWGSMWYTRPNKAVLCEEN